MPEAGRVWAALSELHPRTGLVPIQLDGLHADSLFPGDRQGLPGDALRPWDNGEFSRPEDPREANGLDAGALLEGLWRDWVPSPDQDDPESIERRAPFTLECPAWPRQSTRR